MFNQLDERQQACTDESSWELCMTSQLYRVELRSLVPVCEGGSEMGARSRELAFSSDGRSGRVRRHVSIGWSAGMTGEGEVVLVSSRRYKEYHIW